MSRLSRWALVISAVCACGGLAEDAPRKTAPDRSEYEILFADGSRVRMAVLQESLEIATRYGKLTVPVKDIRRIELASRIPEAVAKKIDAAVQKLGDKAFAQREAAINDLVAIGPRAFPALQNAARSDDAEVSRRAKAGLQLLRQKYSAGQLQVLANDRIHTTEFTIVGRIVTATVKTRTPYFGEVDLQFADLRNLRKLGAGGEGQVTVDAAKYGSAADQWMETEVYISGGTPVTITATGQVDLRPTTPGNIVTGPSGNLQGERGAAFGAAARRAGAINRPGLLLGRIGPNGNVFVIGQRYQDTPTEDGTLYLHIVPGPYETGSTGTYTVNVHSQP